MSSEYIPLEIQEDILKRLPVKPLLRCRSVSKPWKFSIDSPDFIVSYGVRQPPDDRFFLWYDDIFGADKFISLVDNDDSFGQQEFVPTVPDLISIHSGIGSSHGLLCFYGYENMVLLWNPSIRKSVGIQIPNLYDGKLCDYEFYEYGIGFGVCPVTFDPTILIIQYVDFKGKMKDIPSMRGAVFTLSTGTWSVLSTNNLYRESIRLCTGSYQVVIDRFIYWLASDRIERRDGRSQSPFLIMSFDLTTKEFEEINLTGSLTHPLCKIKTISKLRESLVLLGYHREFEGDVSVYSLWMMKKQSVSTSFTKLHNINVPHAKVKTLLGFRKNGELILETKQQSAPNANVSIYDPNSKAIDNLGIDREDRSFFMCSHMETLLLHDQLDGFIYFTTN